MNRREFCRQASIVAVAGVVARSRLFGQTSAPASSVASPSASKTAAAAFGEFRPLRSNVGTFTGRGGTIGWLASRDALAVVDTQFADTAATCLAGLPERGGRQIDVVINTHHHFDHTSGNGTFKRAARAIVAHENVPKLQFDAATRAEQSQKGGARLDQQVYADTTFKDVWRREFPDEVMVAQYHGPAHTSGDAVILFEKANVVHMGDLVFNRMYPVIDRPAGASARGWIHVLEEVAKTYPADAIYVFGHGNPKFGITGRRDDLLIMRDYWSALVSHVEKEIKAGKSRAEVMALANMPGFPDFHSALPNRFGSNLSAVYEELRGGEGIRE